MAIVGVLRPADTDEGYYATAAELVGRGRVPYRDFFYPQAPLLPYLLAPFARIAPSFVALRVVMALFPAAIGAVVAKTVRAETQSRRAAIVSIAPVFTHELGWQWLGSIKTYGPSTFFGVVAVVLVSRRHLERPAAIDRGRCVCGDRDRDPLDARASRARVPRDAHAERRSPIHAAPRGRRVLRFLTIALWPSNSLSRGLGDYALGVRAITQSGSPAARDSLSMVHCRIDDCQSANALFLVD